MALVNIKAAAKVLNCSTQSLYAEEYREGINLPCVRLGRHIKFDERDIERVIESQKEQLRAPSAKKKA